MFRLSQRDPKWDDTKIGKTKFTVGALGCTITSACMVHSKFYPKDFIKPNEAAAIWDFTSQALLKWTSDFDGMEFIKRGYGYNVQDIKEFATKENCGVIVQVENGTHWCAVSSWNHIFNRPILHDPWTGEVLWFWTRKYRNITGYALFKKKS